MTTLAQLPPDPAVDKAGRFATPMRVWLQGLWRLSTALGDTGTTAARTTVNLYVGRMYFDSTLGRPVWIKSLNPTVWVDATGATV